MNIAIITINDPSLESAKRLLPHLASYNNTIFNKKIDKDGFIVYKKLDDFLEEAWNGYDALIFLIATGIVVRKISTLLKSKATDPAVLVISLDLKRIIPLVSGHIGGANELSEHLASSIDECVSFTTTATDQVNVLAFDMFAKKYGYSINNLHKLAEISNASINKQTIQVVTYPAIEKEIKQYNGYQEDLLKIIYPDNLDEFSLELPTVYITPQIVAINALHLQITDISIGVGMNRGTSAKEIMSALKRFCYEHSLDELSISSFASFEAKSNEDGLLEFTKSKNMPLLFFKDDEINALKEKFSPSQATKFFNIKGVAEPSALLASKKKVLFLSKRIYGNVTIAAAF